MMCTEVSKNLDPAWYPDLAEQGGFALSIQAELNRLGSSLVIGADNALPLLWPSLAHGDRSCQVLLAARARSFRVSCWHRGVEYGSGWTPELAQVACLFRDFLEHRHSLKDLASSFAWFQPRQAALLHEADPAAYVESRWRYYESRPHPFDTRLQRMICAAGKHPELRQLRPFTGLLNLCFSRTAGYPFVTAGCPAVHAVDDDRYRVLSVADGATTRIVGEGSAEEAALLLVQSLPSGCGPALDGTSADWQR